MVAVATVSVDVDINGRVDINQGATLRSHDLIVFACITITWLFAYCKGGNFNIHIWCGSAISSA